MPGGTGGLPQEPPLLQKRASRSAVKAPSETEEGSTKRLAEGLEAAAQGQRKASWAVQRKAVLYQEAEQDNLQGAHSQLGKGAAPQKCAQDCSAQPAAAQSQEEPPCKALPEQRRPRAAAAWPRVPHCQSTDNDDMWSG